MGEEMTDQIQGKLHAHLGYTRAVIAERDQLLAEIEGWKVDQKENLKNQCDLHQENVQLRAKVQEQALQIISDIGQEIDAEPVAWGMKRTDGLILDVICPDEHESYEGQYTIPLYTHPPSAQPKAEPVQEPHAWLHDEHQGWVVRMPPPDTGEGRWYPVYTAPQDDLRKAAQQALEWIEAVNEPGLGGGNVAKALREALK
jgi:hypothetical protein